MGKQKCTKCGTEIDSGGLCDDCSSRTNDLIEDIKKDDNYGKGKKN